MGQYVRWQAIIVLIGAVLLLAYLSSITVKKTTVIVPAEGGTYREGVVGTIQYLNPLLAEYNPLDQDIAGLIFEGLTRDDGLGNLKPQLAENWSVSADGRVYVFVLRKGVKWSDGAPFGSDDVVFTLNLIQSANYPGNPAWQRVWQGVTIEQVDDYTLRFVLDEAFPSFIYFTTVGILPAHRLDDLSAKNLLTHPFNLSPVGTGPFKLAEATNRHILLSRNPRFWGQPSRIEQIEFKLYPNQSALHQAFENKEIDGMGQLFSQNQADIHTRSGMQLHSTPLPRYGLVYLNLQQPEALPFFQDSAIRQALLMALDRRAIVDRAMNGQAIEANGPFLPWNWAYNPSQTYPEYDPAQAAQMLDNAGWLDSDNDGLRDNNGQALAFTLLVNTNLEQIQIAQQIAQQWQKAGIAVEIESMGGDLSARLQNHQFEAALIEVELFGDPDPYAFWHQTQIDGGQNFAGWDNTPASLALEQGRVTLDQDERLKHYYEFQRIFAQELPAFILYHPVYTYWVQDTVKNVQLAPLSTPADRFRGIQTWYLLTRRVIETTANQSFTP